MKSKRMNVNYPVYSREEKKIFYTQVDKTHPRHFSLLPNQAILLFLFSLFNILVTDVLPLALDVMSAKQRPIP